MIAQGTSDDVFMVGKMAAFQIQNLLVAYKERYDKDNFIKNLLLDNLLLVDIYNRAKKLHVDVDARRCVCIIETKNEKDSVALETVRTLFAGSKKDFITAVDEKSIILVKELDEKQGYEDIEKIDETKKDLHRQQRQVIANQRMLKKMAKFVILLIISLFVLFAVLYYAMEVDMTYPYLGTILLAAISATVIFAESLRNRTEAAWLGKKNN